jgi:hypothetical protein
MQLALDFVALEIATNIELLTASKIEGAARF